MGIFSKIKSTFSSQQVDEITQEISTQTEEAEILKIISKWKGSVSPEFVRAVEVEGKRNYSYFIGDYSRDKQSLKYGKSNIVVNHIFSAIKSVTPFVTSKPAEPVVYPKKYNIDEEKTDEAKKLSLYAQEIIKKIYKDSSIQQLNEANTINRYIYKIGILRYGIKDNKIFTRLVDPCDIIIDSGAKRWDDKEYIGEKIRIPVDQLIELYPNKKDIFLRKAQGKTDIRLEVVEWWTNDIIVVEMDNKIIDVKDNPYKNSNNPILKYYDYAPIPFVNLSVYNTGRSIVDDISEIDLTYKIQDSLNDLNRQILDNARFTGNPIKIGIGISADQLSEINKIEPGDSVILPAG